jgi:hypothetical protein
MLMENRFPAIWLPSKELQDLRALLRSLLPPENSIPRVFARPCISQRRKGEAASSISGLKRPEVSLETL